MNIIFKVPLKINIPIYLKKNINNTLTKTGKFVNYEIKN